MNNKKLFNIIFLLLIVLPVLAQGQDILLPCGTAEKTDEEMEDLPWYGNNDYLDQISVNFADILGGNMEVEERGICPDIDGRFLIPVRFWIYQANSSDLGIPNDRDLQRMMDRLNFLYQDNGMNVRFFMVCPRYEINAAMTAATGWDGFWANFTGNSDGNAINVHIVADVVKTEGVHNSFSDIILVDRDVYSGQAAVSTLAHEIGHFFRLEHTHRNATKGQCRAEAVSRTRNFPFCIPPRTGRICEKNGDALCDTPADPELSWGSPSIPKVSENCIYTWGELDNWGDTYVPDETNIMSYSRRACRTTFSVGQTIVMAESMRTGREALFSQIDFNETDPDQYEPDDSDFPNVPRTIALGETQCHSFHDISSCQDEADWLIMSLTNGVIGSYQIKIDQVDGEPYPVEKVNVWNIGSNGMRSTNINTSSSVTGTTTIFEFPCSTTNTGNLLLEVVRQSNVSEGKYSITLTSSQPLSISGNDIICKTTSYSVNGLPSGATVSWTSSPSITLTNTTGATVTIQNFTTGAPTYWLEALVLWNGCTQKIRRTFTFVIGAGIPDFIILEKSVACFPGGGEFYISTPAPGVTYSWSCSGVACGSIQAFSNGQYALTQPNGMGAMVITVTATDGCGNSVTRTKSVQVTRCGHKMEGIIVTPNPTTTGNVGVSIQDTYEIDGKYEVYITNQMSEVKYQSEKFTKDFNINLVELPNGIYYIHVYREEISGSSSFIINK